MVYSPYNQSSPLTQGRRFDSVIDTALVQNLLDKVTDFNQRIAPIESNFAGISANAVGAVATNAVQTSRLQVLTDQIMGLAQYVTSGALSSIPITTTTSYANFPPFAVRAYGIENRLNVIGA